jgi:four helix bundle protein
MRIEKFEDIEAWREARNLNKVVYQISTRNLFKRDFGLSSQIQRASISVMANIAEGFDRQSNKEFIKYLYIASSSASEIQSHLYAALDLAYINDEDFNNLYEQAKKVKRLINGFIAYLKGRKAK